MGVPLSCCAPLPGGTPEATSAVEHPWERGSGRDTIPCADVVQLSGGTFLMGSQDADVNIGDGESPVRSVTVAPFGIARHTVTNARFREFVDATDYVTEAHDFGWSFVFHLLLDAQVRDASAAPAGTPWWRAVEGAFWDSPTGPGSGIEDILDHPVVHVSWRDAEAYAHWVGGRLPMENEWEYAARGGLERARYAWGDELTPGGEHRCNIWQGSFPTHNSAEDGFVGTAPVASFAPNGYGLFDVAGNVWEMCADEWNTNPADPAKGITRSGARVMRGGSYLCHDSYCNRYRVAARTSNTSDSAAGNLGFRVAFDPR